MSREFEVQRELVEAKLTSWMEGPLVFASGSKAKADKLRDGGFTGEMTQVSPPEHVERIMHEEYVAAYGGDHIDGFRRGAAMEVAWGKVAHVLGNTDVPDDAFVLAADTMPMVFPNEIDTDGNVWWANAIEKPKTPEDAKQIIKKMFSEIIEGYLGYKNQAESYRELIESRDLDDEEKQRRLDTMMIGELGICIGVSNGFAVSPPELRKKFTDINKQILIFKDEMKLYPEALYRMVDESLGDTYIDLGKDHDAQTFDELVKEVLGKIDEQLDGLINEIVEEAGEEVVTKVSGGVPYQNKRIRDMLGIRVCRDMTFYQGEEIDEDWFSGMPTKELVEELRPVALQCI